MCHCATWFTLLLVGLTVNMICKDSFTLTFTLTEDFQWKAIQILLIIQSAVHEYLNATKWCYGNQVYQMAGAMRNKTFLKPYKLSFSIWFEKKDISEGYTFIFTAVSVYI